MYALIQKSDNKILRFSDHGPTLADEKPFYWEECPDNCNSSWTYDGYKFIAPKEPDIVPIDYNLMKRQAYQEESDPVFFKWQRGEATQQDWIDKVNEIKARYPEGE
jgi:hypothetical protein